ncbi:hypothetical protein LXL04_004439 [Taraxacum kok-saghyz]
MAYAIFEHLCLRAGRSKRLRSKKVCLFFGRQKRFAEVKTSAGGKTWFKVCGRVLSILFQPHSTLSSPLKKLVHIVETFIRSDDDAGDRPRRPQSSFVLHLLRSRMPDTKLNFGIPSYISRFQIPPPASRLLPLAVAESLSPHSPRTKSSSSFCLHSFTDSFRLHQFADSLFEQPPCRRRPSIRYVRASKLPSTTTRRRPRPGDDLHSPVHIQAHNVLISELMQA